MKRFLRYSFVLTLILMSGYYGNANISFTKYATDSSSYNRINHLSKPSKKTYDCSDANTPPLIFPYFESLVTYKGGYYCTLLSENKSNYSYIGQLKNQYFKTHHYDTEKLSSRSYSGVSNLHLPSYVIEKMSSPNLELLSPENRENLNIDSLMEKWHTGHSLIHNDFDFVLDTTLIDTVAIPDEVFKQRIREIPAIVDLAYNANVRKEIERYLRKRSQGYIQRMIGKAHYYLPLIESVFDSYDLPQELKYLPIIESAINPVAVSRAGAMGMWQFMPGTSKLYDIKLNKYVDERCDPLKATHAAANHFLNLYSRYHDWTLVLAAYNCGSGNVNKAIERSGGKTSYWEIWSFLPKETRDYVPRYIAAVYLMNYYEMHNMVSEPFDMPQVTDTVSVSGTLHLSQIASVLDYPIEKIRALNPQYKKDLVPARDEALHITLPLDMTLKFIELQDSIFAEDIKKSDYVISNYKVSSAGSTKGKDKLVYTVKSGDNVGLIAQWYNVKSADIKVWNNIYRNKIIVGEKLDIYLEKSCVKSYASIDKMSFEKKQARYKKTKITDKPKITKDGKYVYYTIESGDNFWDIANKFDGVSCDNILEINNFSKRTKINPGDIIRIKPL